jgi:hypothetical protein
MHVDPRAILVTIRSVPAIVVVPIVFGVPAVVVITVVIAVIIRMLTVS